MSAVKLYIGSELADFNEVFNVMFSIFDIRNPSFGSANKSYTLNLPLTKTNKRLLKFNSQIDVKSEPSAIARLYAGETLIMQGSPIITSHSLLFAKVTISSDDWMDNLKEVKMTSLDLSASDHELSQTVIEDSWTASYPVFRYPMIDFGGLVSGEYGSAAKWCPNDFIPMISIATLITEILKPYTIISTWLATAKIKDTYILARETIAKDDFLKNKGLEIKPILVTNNQAQVAINPSETISVTLIIDRVLFPDVITDEAGGIHTAYEYTIPETGTYRFQATIDMYNTFISVIGMTMNWESITLRIIKNHGATTTTLCTINHDPSATNRLNGVQYSLDTQYCHFEVNDIVFVSIQASSNLTNTTGGIITKEIGVDITSKMISVWTNVNKYSGLTKTISLEELLPDMTQLDFLAAIRDCYNLKFWMDKSKGNIYIEPDINSSTIIDLTPFVDFESIDTELISPNYSKTTALRWSKDSDEAFNEYVKVNTEGPGRKDVVLTSLFTRKEISYKDHPFSTLVTGIISSFITSDTYVPQIWNSIPISPYNIFDRKVGFNTRLVKWSGMTSGFTWYLGTTSNSAWPKIEGITWTELYTDYWQPAWHDIDKGKILTCKIKTTPTLLSQFITVTNNVDNEGFRPIYSIEIDGILNYFKLQKVTSDGDIAELELILKS